MNKPKIAFIGFARHLAEKQHWMQTAEDSGLDVTVLGYDQQGKERILQEKWPYLSLGPHMLFENALRYRILFSLYARFQEKLLEYYLRTIRPDIIHGVNIMQLLIAHRLGTSLQIPTITSTTGLGDTADIVTQNNHGNYVQERISTACDKGHVTFQNPDDMSMFTDAKILEEKRASIVHGSGIDTKRFSPSATGNNEQKVQQISQIGLLSFDKGADVFLKAAEILRHRTDLRFVLCGERSKDFPSSHIADTKNVQWLGYTEDIIPTLHASSIVTLLSTKHREGVPRSLIEAQSCGLAVVTTNVPGNRELVKHNYNGIVVQPNDPNSVADAISSLADSPEMRKEMGNKGHHIVENEYSVEAVGDTHRKLYDSLLRS